MASTLKPLGMVVNASRWGTALGMKSLACPVRMLRDEVDWRLTIRGQPANPGLHEKWPLKTMHALLLCYYSVKISVVTVIYLCD